MAHRRLVQAERNVGTQLQPHRLVREQAIRDVRRVLQVRHHHALLEPHTLDVVGPDRKTGLEAEVRQIPGAVDFLPALGLRHVVQRRHPPVRPPHPFPQEVEHHGAAERRRQSRDQQAVVSARQRARQRPRRVATEPVRDQPFSRRERPPPLLGRLPRDAADEFAFSQLDDRHLCAPVSGQGPHGPVAANLRGARRRTAPAVLRRFARPRHSPHMALRRGDQWLGERRCHEVAPEVQDEQTFVGGLGRGISQDERSGARIAPSTPPGICWLNARSVRRSARRSA